MSDKAYTSPEYLAQQFKVQLNAYSNQRWGIGVITKQSRGSVYFKLKGLGFKAEFSEEDRIRLEVLAESGEGGVFEEKLELKRGKTGRLSCSAFYVFIRKNVFSELRQSK
jgi:hypothetical protein